MKISEREFEELCKGIREDSKSIIRHNPIGTDDEVLLWMLLGCLTSYLSLSEIETPCFNGKPDATSYQDAILFILKDRKTEEFDPRPYLKQLIRKVI